jgi:flagellar basal body-associated protein FliL
VGGRAGLDGGDRNRSGASRVTSPYLTTGGTDLSILWIILIVILVLALLGFFGRGRF